MNTIASRLKALGITAGFFALSALALLSLIWGLTTLPFSFPGRAALDTYRPHDSIAAVSDLRILAALTAAYLIAGALVLIINSNYCDRMLAIFADVLLMLVASMVGFVAGYWLLLRLAGFENFVTLPFLQTFLLCPAIVLAVSLLPFARLRNALPVRILMIVVLALAAPVVLMLVP